MIDYLVKSVLFIKAYINTTLTLLVILIHDNNRSVAECRFSDYILYNLLILNHMTHHNNSINTIAVEQLKDACFSAVECIIIIEISAGAENNVTPTASCYIFMKRIYKALNILMLYISNTNSYNSVSLNHSEPP